MTYPTTWTDAGVEFEGDGDGHLIVGDALYDLTWSVGYGDDELDHCELLSLRTSGLTLNRDQVVAFFGGDRAGENTVKRIEDTIAERLLEMARSGEFYRGIAAE